MGTSPFSEPETQAINSYYQCLSNVVAAVDFHSYSQLILRPHAFSNINSQHESEFKRVSNLIANAMKAVDNKSYYPQKSIDLYASTGTALDYFYLSKPHNNTHWVFSIMVELRPNTPQSGGILLPPSQIIPTGKEALAALLQIVVYKLE